MKDQRPHNRNSLAILRHSGNESMRQSPYRRNAKRLLVAATVAIPALAGCTPIPLTPQPSNPVVVSGRPISSPLPTTIVEGSQFAADATARPASVTTVAWAEPAPTPTPTATVGKASPPIEGMVVDTPPPPKESGLDFHVRGRIEAEAISVKQDQKNKDIYGEYQNSVGFRRARIGAEGSFNDQTRWVAEWDFASGDIKFKDMFVAIDKLPILREVRIGNFAEPYSLEGQTRSVWFPFTERSQAFSLDPARNWGVGVYSHTDDKQLVIQLAAVRSGTDSNNGEDSGNQNDWAFDARVVWVPWYNDAEDSFGLLHIGGAISQRNAKNDTVSFNQGPQATLLQSGTDRAVPPFTPEITMKANQNQLYNLQSALVLGPLSFQAEWNATQVEQLKGGNVFFHGGYILASYFLTGEHRNYNRDFGTFWEPTVHSPFVCADGNGGIHGPGAWELAARLAWMNYDNSNLPLGSNGLPQGSKQTTFTLGVNWYLNDNTRLMVDYVHAIPVDPTFGSSNADTFTIRTAMFW